MGLYKSETVKMVFNGYNYKAEWKIPNFIAFTGNEYNSPLFSSDNFQVQLSLKNSLSKDNDGLEITFNFVSIPTSGLSFNYNLSIENTDKNKSEKITGDEVLNNSKTEFKVFTKTQSSQIKAENGYLLDGALTIICFFRTNSNFDDIYLPGSHEKIIREVAAETDWTINESINEFHSTEEPLQISIDGKILSFAFTFEKTEKDNYSLSLILVEPEFSFNGESEITLINNKDDQKSIKKTQKLKFDQIQYETDPITFDEISQEILMNPENGWVVLNKDTSEIESGVHFHIKFINLKKEEESKESIFSRLSKMTIHNEKELRETIPITIQPIRSNKFDFKVKFPNILSCNLEEQIISPEFHTGGICERYIIDFPSKSFFFDIIDFPQNGSFLKAKITFLNQDPSREKTIAFSFLYCPSKKCEAKELPISIQDVSNPEKGWLFDGALKIRAEFEAKSYTKSYLYPVSTNASSNDLYGFRFYIPISLFDPEKETKIIDFPSVIAKKINITPFISYSYDENNGNKIKIQTNFETILPKDESIIDFIFAYENKNEDKNIIETYADADREQYQLPLFIPEKSLEEDGFVFESESSKKVLRLCLRIHYKEKNAYTSDYTTGAYSSVSYEQRKTQDESKEPAMLPDRSISAEQQAKARSKHADSFENYGDFGLSDEINYGPHDFASKRDTGYVGLKNQGATCYMNSLLQSLYHLPAFRRLVYDLPTTGSEDPNTCIPLNLQRLFSQMQFSDKSCSTVNLTKSFGWGSAETFQQHDIEEFLRVLIDNLENKMKGTDLQDSIPHLFRGKYRNYIRCKNVDYQSSREESFYDLSMDVKGIPNLYESFKSYVKKDELTGDNQYDAEGHGKQDAIMGTEFIEFPPVLHLHLRRFMFDFTRQNGMYKINDQFEFPESIDLTEFLAKDSPDRERSNVYDLYGVLVHQGGVFGGHYYAFLRTSTSPQWYKFNDSFVSKDTAEHAIDDNFGYSPDSPFSNNNENIMENGQKIPFEDEENDENETELDEIVNDNERRFTENRAAEMGIDICGGGKEEDDISIHGRDETFTDWRRHHNNEVFDRETYDRIKKEMKKKNKNNKHKSDHVSHKSEKSYSGYMLVYVRRDDAESIFEPISDESVPSHLRSYMNNIVREEKSSAKDKPTTIIHCAHESVLRKNSANNNFGFFPPETENIVIKPEKKEEEKKETETEKSNENQPEKKEEEPKIDLSINSFDQTFEKTISTAELYASIASRVGLDPSKIRLWRCGYENLPTKIIPNSEKCNVASVSDGKNGMTVFIQSMKEASETLDIGNNYMIYIKFFFSEELLKRQNEADKTKLLKKQLKTPLQYLFSTTVSHDSKIESLYSLINEKLGFPKDSKLEAYQETLSKNVAKLTPETIFRKSSIGNGSTLIFEMNQESIEKVPQNSLKINFDFEYPADLEEEEAAAEASSSGQQSELEPKSSAHLKLYRQNDLDNEKSSMKSIQNYFQGENSITLEIYDYTNKKQPLCLIQFSREIKISEAKRFILRAASESSHEADKYKNVDLSSILLFRMKNDEIVKIETDQMYANQMLRFHYHDEPPKGKKHHQLYFYISPFKGVKTQDFTKYVTKFSADAKTIDAEESVYLPKNSKCGDIFRTFKTFFTKESNPLIKEMFNESNKFRFLLIEEHVIERVYTSESTVVPYDAKMSFRIEVVPKNQLHIDTDKLLRCYYSLDCSKNRSSSFNQPFLMDVVKDELFEDTKKRLKIDFMDLPETDQLDTYKFYLLIGEGNNSLELANSKRMERKKKIESESETRDVTLSGFYEVNSTVNTKFVVLDNFSMLYEFAEENTYELQLIIVLSKRDSNLVNYVKSDNAGNSKKDDKEKDKIELRPDVRPDRPKNSPAKSHPSHNDVRIYN